MLSLFGKGKDWIKAPIAGTAMLICFAGIIYSAVHGSIDRMLLWSILFEVISLRRDKYLEEDND